MFLDCLNLSTGTGVPFPPDVVEIKQQVTTAQDSQIPTVQKVRHDLFFLCVLDYVFHSAAKQVKCYKWNSTATKLVVRLLLYLTICLSPILSTYFALKKDISR